VGPADEVIEHLLGGVVVGDDAVPQRPHHLDGAGRAAQHRLGLRADSDHRSVCGTQRDDRGLVEHDAFPRRVHERVRRAEIDGHVAGEEVAEEAKKHPRVRRQRMCQRRGGRPSGSGNVYTQEEVR
jgi:hypothetical protein